MVTDLPARLADEQLLSRVAVGDLEAFEAIYDRYGDQAFGVAMRVTRRRRGAEEATQDAFVSLWRNAAGYDVARGSLKSWLLCMARNRSIDWLRREARHGQEVEIEQVMIERLEHPERTEDVVAARDESRRARQMLAALPVDQRQVIELAYFGGLTHVEIAARIGIPLGTVKGRQRLALLKLRRALSGTPQLLLAG